jgi:hypothetical protein
MMVELSQLLASIAAIFLLFAAVAWLRPSGMLAMATVRRKAAVAPLHDSQAASVFLLLALGSSAIAAVMAVIDMFTS